MRCEQYTKGSVVYFIIGNKKRRKNSVHMTKQQPMLLKLIHYCGTMSNILGTVLFFVCPVHSARLPLCLLHIHLRYNFVCTILFTFRFFIFWS